MPTVKTKSAQRYIALNALAISIAVYSGPNAERLQIPIESLRALIAKINQWLAVFRRYQDPNLRTRAIVAELRTATEILLPAIRQLQQRLKTNTAIVLTGDDYAAFGIRENKATHTRTRAAQDAPHVVQVGIVAGANVFQTQYQKSNGALTRAMPGGMLLLAFYAYRADSEPPLESDFRYVQASGKSKIALHAPPLVEPGAAGYVKCCYVNTHGEMGPLSEVLRFVVN